MKTSLLQLLLLVFIFSVTACKSTSTTSGSDKEISSLHSKDKESNVEKIDQTTNSPTTQLVDLMRRLPGVNIQGTHPNVIATVRGATSTNGAKTVLYVVDNVPMGNDYNQVWESIDITRVKTVSVLKGGETAIYGEQGSGGVIVIKLKPNRAD
jgi:outer membrane receptor protein involved in Fe transport